MTVLKYNEITDDVINNLKFDYQEANKRVDIKYNGSRLTIQGTTLYSQLGGIDRRKYGTDEKTGKPTIKLSFKAMEVNDDVQQLFNDNVRKMNDVFRKLEKRFKNELRKNSKEWMNIKNMDDDLLNDTYKPGLNVYKDPETEEETGKFPDYLRLNLDDYVYNDNHIVSTFFDSKTHNLIEDEDTLAHGKFNRMYIKPVITIENLYITNTVGPRYKLDKGKVFRSLENKNKFSFVPDEE